MRSTSVHGDLFSTRSHAPGSCTITDRAPQQLPRVSANFSDFIFEKKATLNSDDHAKSMFGWNQLCDQLTPGSFRGNVVEMWFKGIQIFRATANRSVCQSGLFWKGYRVIGIPVEMSGSALLSKQKVGLNNIFTFHSEQDFSLTTPEEFDGIAVVIPEAALEHLMVSDGMHGIHRLIPDTLNVLQPCPDKLSELRKCLTSVLDPSNFQPELLRYPQVQQSMHESIIGHVMETLRSAHSPPTSSPSFKTHSYLVNEAISITLANASEPPTIEALCCQLKVSQRMLHYSFIETVGLAPLQYLRSRRLNGVRRAICTAAHSQCNTSECPIAIADIAEQWGFTHLSRFASDYRSLFGELPSATLKNSLNIKRRIHS